MRRYSSASAANAIDAGSAWTRRRNSSSRGFSGIRKTLPPPYCVTVTGLVTLLVRPVLSVTVRTTLNVLDVVPAGRLKLCVVVCPVPSADPSSKFQTKLTIVRPGDVSVLEALKVTCVPGRGADGLNVKLGVGLPFPTV